MSVSVVTDSVAAIPADLLAEYGIEVVSLYVNDGESNQLEVEMDTIAFYKRLEEMTTLPTSSQPSVDALLGAFRRALQRGQDVLGVFISAKMSGTCETAHMAADMLRDDFCDARIEIIDSGSNSMEEGYGVLAAAAAAQAGEPMDSCIRAATETLGRTRYLFTPHTLEYLRRGGRIGGASALIGGLLQIRPILTVERGETQTFARVRTQAKALSEMTRKFTEDTRDFGLEQVCVHFISDRETAERFAREQIEPLVSGPVRVLPVSPVIGVHVGPAVAIVYTTTRDWT